MAIVAVGFCMFCGDDGSQAKLTDEHAAPEGISGGLVLKRASCSRCACATSYSELKILRGPFSAAREYFGLYGKRRKIRPTTFPLSIRRRDWTEEVVHLPLGEYPMAFRMPLMPAPRFIKPADADDSDFLRKHDYRRFESFAADAQMRGLVAADPGRENVSLDLEVFELSKVLAKIAYCMSVYMLGPRVIPYVANLIAAPRGTAPSFLRYVGGAHMFGSPVEQLGLGELGKCVVFRELIDGIETICARVQLLCAFGTPVYEVVVGRDAADGEMQRYLLQNRDAERFLSYRELQSLSFGEVMAAGYEPGR